MFLLSDNAVKSTLDSKIANLASQESQYWTLIQYFLQPKTY